METHGFVPCLYKAKTKAFYIYVVLIIGKSSKYGVLCPILSHIWTANDNLGVTTLNQMRKISIIDDKHIADQCFFFIPTGNMKKI